MKKTILLAALTILATLKIDAQENTTSFNKNAIPLNGYQNSAFGVGAGVNNIKRDNVFIGFESGKENKGDGNVFVGSGSGKYSTEGSGNIFLGCRAGVSETGSGLLYIESSESIHPLIWGDFRNDLVNINGLFGINNSQPNSAFNLGSATVRSDNYIVFGRRVTSDDTSLLPFIGHDSFDGGSNDLAFGSGFKGGFSFYTETATGTFNPSNIKMRIDTDGKVGIGTITPDEKLSVNGKIHAKEVRVDLIGWPDYVFNNNYDLVSLEILEKYIQENGHLPNIPNAEEVENNGILLGEMNAKLLEKIEELTLYTIQQQKELEFQKKQNKTLEERLVKIELLVSQLNK